MKGLKSNKREFVSKFVGIIVTTFPYKNLSQIPCKDLSRQCSYTDHLKHKIMNKTICIGASASPLHSCAH